MLYNGFGIPSEFKMSITFEAALRYVQHRQEQIFPVHAHDYQEYPLRYESCIFSFFHL